MTHRPNGRTIVRGCVAPATALAAILAAAATLWSAGVLTSGAAAAKTPGKTYCFFGFCHRVRTIEETAKAVGTTHIVKASHYDDPKRDRYNPSKITSSGEYFRSDLPDNAASPVWPDGTKLLLWNPANQRSALVRVNNAGPYWGQRQLDVSRATAEKLGFARNGVATLHSRVVEAPTPSEATYRRGRSYEPVPGFLGVFQSIEMALAGVGKAIEGVMAPPAVAAAGDGRLAVAAKPALKEPPKPPVQVARAEPRSKPAPKPESRLVVATKPPTGNPTKVAAAAKVAPAKPSGAAQAVRDSAAGGRPERAALAQQQPAPAARGAAQPQTQPQRQALAQIQPDMSWVPWR